MATRKFSSALINNILGSNSQTKMAGSRLILSCLTKSTRIPSIRLYSDHHGPPVNYKIGNREIVGYGLNGQPGYIDLHDFPLPSIRFKEVTPDIQVLRDKEKGDWKKMSIEDKKALYRASFCQTFAEVDAPTGEWKSIAGGVFIGLSLAFLIFTFLKQYVYSPLPESFSEKSQLAQLDRMRKLDVNPIYGLNRRD